MKGLLIAALLLAPLCGLYAEQGAALKSAVIVEQGLFKKGWERDFFRDIFPAEKPVETADTAATAPDEAPPLPDADNSPQRRIGSSIQRERPVAATPAVVTPPEETVKEPDPVVPPPAEQLLLPPRRPEPEAAPVAPRTTAPQKELIPPQEPVDNKKKQKDRARELDSKRKKGNFRDPKITY